MTAKEFYPDQRKLADALARKIFPGSFALERRIAPVDIQSVHGDEAALEFARIVEIEQQLTREGAFGEYVLNKAGCQPPYEISVPKEFPWVRIEPVLAELSNQTLKT